MFALGYPAVALAPRFQSLLSSVLSAFAAVRAAKHDTVSVQRARVRARLSTRLPPHLIKDVVADDD
jgi:hypothetical protein